MQNIEDRTFLALVVVGDDRICLGAAAFLRGDPVGLVVAILFNPLNLRLRRVAGAARQPRLADHGAAGHCHRDCAADPDQRVAHPAGHRLL